ncbi:DNA recombination protein RmuC [Thermodesulfobacteriota bacterium]
MEILIVSILVILLFALIWIYRQMNTRIENLNSQLIESKALQDNTTKSFGQIQSSLGRLTEASRHMEDVGKEISGLSDILRAPKLRGGIGELLLGDLLSQILSPDHFKLQYTYKSGERVDAIILLKAGKVPVDAKFPLESFQRMAAADEEGQKKHKREFMKAVKNHINSISQKYILPDEGTFDFALMYIPAENVYYETIIKDEGLEEEKSIMNHALEKKVIPVSPNSFYAYLQSIALGLRGLRIEKRAHEIMQQLARIENDFTRFKSEYSTLGGHMERARKKYEDTSKLLDRFEGKFIQARDPSVKIAPSDDREIESGVNNK